MEFENLVFNPNIAMTWILYLALFPMAFIWLRRAYRIMINKNYSEVALKKGEPPKNPKKWAPFAALINFTCGAICAWVIIGVATYLATGVLIGPFQGYDSWSAVAGTTIWGKIIADYILRSQAHPFQFGKKKEQKTCTT